MHQFEWNDGFNDIDKYTRELGLGHFQADNGYTLYEIVAYCLASLNNLVTSTKQ